MSDASDRSRRLLGYDLADGRNYIIVAEDNGDLDDPDTTKRLIGVKPSYLGGPKIINMREGETRYMLSSKGGQIIRVRKDEDGGIILEDTGGIPKRYSAIVPPPGPGEDKPDTTARKNEPETAPAPATEKKPRTLKPIDEELLKQCFEDLNGIVGLDDAKKSIRKKISLARGQREKMELGLPMDAEFSLHLVLTGNPGTGKTTVARIYGKFMKALGFLDKGHLVECKEDDLVAGYLGQTAIKTNKKIDEALDGVLYVDEAHNMLPEDGVGGQYHRQSLGVMTARMENDRDRLVMVLSGYRKPIEALVKKTPGFPSRFKTFIHNEDYKPDELNLIFNGMAEQRHYSLAPGAAEAAHNAIAERKQVAGEQFENGREVRNILEDAIENMFARTCAPDRKGKLVAEMTEEEKEARRKELSTLLPEDFNQQSNGFRLREEPRRGIGFTADLGPSSRPTASAAPPPTENAVRASHNTPELIA